MSEERMRNAVISSTMLGFEDHGILTFFLHLDYGGAGQGFGGYFLKSLGMEAIARVLETVGVLTWEELPGKHIRTQGTHGHIHAIANILEGEWLTFDSEEAPGE